MEFSKRISYLIKGIFWYIKRKIFYTKKDKLSKGEGLITAWLRYSNCKFTPQYKIYIPELYTKTNNAYIDFYIEKGKNKYAIEFNGKQHYEYIPFFHQNGISDFFKQRRRDKLVLDWCNKHNVELIEIPYTYSADEIVSILKQYFG